MPAYVRAGSVPHKRHIQFRRPDGGLYAEELFSTKGFESVYSLLRQLEWAIRQAKLPLEPVVTQAVAAMERDVIKRTY